MHGYPPVILSEILKTLPDLRAGSFARSHSNWRLPGFTPGLNQDVFSSLWKGAIRMVTGLSPMQFGAGQLQSLAPSRCRICRSPMCESKTVARRWPSFLQPFMDFQPDR